MKITDIVKKSGTDKGRRYDRSALLANVEHCQIPICMLNVDDYQRGEASCQGTLKKAAEYDPAAAGAITVGKRADGTCWVVDGLQRVLAMATRGDMYLVDCMVFDSKGREHEAKVFQRCNMGRTPVRSIHKYRVAVDAGDEPHVTIEAWLKVAGLKVSKGAGQNEVGFPTRLVAHWETDAEATMRAVTFAWRVGEGVINAFVFEGAFILIRKGVDIESHEQSIVSKGGSAKIKRDIKTLAIESGANLSPMVCAQGLLATINHGKRKKVTI